jgi:hypothetical protein
MSLHDRFAAVLDRLAASTSIVRSREQDASRAARDGVDDGALESLVARLEHVVREFERTLA